MAVALALAAALTWGTGDFLGGKTTRNHAVLTVITASQTIGLVTLTIGALVLGGTLNARDMALGSAGSLIGVAGLMLLYWGLAHGQMSVVAPVTAVTGPIPPLLWGLGSGEQLSPIAATGAALGLAAIVLISRASDDGSTRLSVQKSITIGLASGVLLGLFLLILGNVGDDSGLWPLVAARLTSVPVLIMIALHQRVPVIPRKDRSTISLIGVFDSAANALVLLAFRAGQLSVGAVLSSLYPAATVLLARVVDQERLTRPQILGLAVGAVAVGCLVAG